MIQSATVFQLSALFNRNHPLIEEAINGLKIINPKYVPAIIDNAALVLLSYGSGGNDGESRLTLSCQSNFVAVSVPTDFTQPVWVSFLGHSDSGSEHYHSNGDVILGDEKTHIGRNEQLNRSRLTLVVANALESISKAFEIKTP